MLELTKRSKLICDFEAVGEAYTWWDRALGHSTLRAKTERIYWVEMGTRVAL